MNAAGFDFALEIALAKIPVVFTRLSITVFLKFSVNGRRGLRTFSPARFTAANVPSGIPFSSISF